METFVVNTLFILDPMSDQQADVPDSIDELDVSCDCCGKGLLIDSNVRYEVEIEVKAAYDPLEITDDDLSENHEKEMDRTLKELEELSEEEVKEQVYKKMEFNLCSSCQSDFLESPLPDAKS